MNKNNGISKETRKQIRKNNREFRKAEKEGRVRYDPNGGRIWIFDKEDKTWKLTIDFWNR